MLVIALCRFITLRVVQNHFREESFLISNFTIVLSSIDLPDIRRHGILSVIALQILRVIQVTQQNAAT